MLIALAIVVFLVTSKGAKKAESYTDQLVHAVQKADQLQLDSKISAIQKALESYNFDNGKYPDDLEELVPNYLPIEEHIKDPWGEKFTIEPDGEVSVIIMSSGKDRIPGNADDITRRIQ